MPCHNIKWGMVLKWYQNIILLYSMVMNMGLKKKQLSRLLPEQSDQGLYCLPFCLHLLEANLLDAIPYCKGNLFEF